MMIAKSLTIVIPVFNEIDTLCSVVETVTQAAAAQGWHVIAVDDGSHDGSGALLDELQAQHIAVLRVLHHSNNRGYGAALKTGIRASATTHVLTMDADGQHTVQHIHLMLEQDGDQDLVIGQRTALLHSPMWRMPGKWILKLFAEFMSRQRIPDLNSGLRLFRRQSLLKYLHLFPDGFSFSTTSTLIFLNRGLNIAYVPVEVRRRQNKSTVKLSTGFQTLLLILRLMMQLDPLRIFVPMSILFVSAGVIWALPYLALRRGLTTVALLLVLTGILIFLFGLLADQIAELRKEHYETNDDHE